MNPYGEENRPVGADVLPTSADIAPGELRSPVVPPQNTEVLDSWLNEKAARTADASDNYAASQDPSSLKSINISLPKFMTWVAALMILVPAVAFGAYGAYHAFRHPEQNANQTVASNSNDATNQLLGTSQNQLHVNFDTIFTGGKGLTANGTVLVQNQITNGFQIENAAGSSLLTADTANNKVAVGGLPTANGAALQVTGDISTNGSLVSTDGGFSLNDKGLTIGGKLVCTAAGCISSTPLPNTPSIDTSSLDFLNVAQTLTAAKALHVNSTRAFQIQNSGGGGNLLVADTTDGALGVGMVPVNGLGALQVAGAVSATNGFVANGVAGDNFTCPSGQLLQQAVIVGGLVTSGSCVTIAGGTTPSLQQVYDSSFPASVVLSNASGMLQIQDAASPLASDLFEVTSNGAVTKYFAVNNLGISVTGNITTTGQYQVNGTQISSANLSNDANLAKLNANQTFTGNNTFNSASNSFTGNGSGLTSLNASNISAGTLNDGRLSANVALLNATQTFTASNTFKASSNSATAFQIQNAAGTDNLLIADTLNNRVGIGKAPTLGALDVNGAIYQSGNQVCDTSGNCVGTGGAGAGIGGSGSTNTIPVFTGVGTIGNSILTQAAGVVTAGGSLNVTGTYQVNGSQIASSNLSDGANLAKLNGNQTFTGTNTFNNAANSFTGNGSNLTSLSASNISSGTLNDSRLSANVALLNGTGPQTFTGNNKFTGTVLSQNTSNSTTAFQIQNAAGTSNLFIADTTNSRVGIGKAPTLGALDVNGSIFQSGNQVCDTSGNCVGTGGGGSIGGSGTANTIALFTGSGFTIGNSILTQAAGTVSAAGNLNVTGAFQVNGSQIASSNLSNDANLAKLNGNQTFTGNNTFSSASNSFTGSGSGLTSLNASNVSSGTLSDSRLSSNVALLNANQTFTGNNTFDLASTGFTIQDALTPLGTDLFAVTDNSGTTKYFEISATGAKVNGNTVCTTAGNCSGTGGGVTTPGGTTNKLAKFTGSQTIGDSIITDNGSTVTIGGTLAVNTISPTAALTVGLTTQGLTLQGDGTTKLTATASGTTNSIMFAAPSGANKSVTVPNANGTFVVSSSGPLSIDAAGNITCPNCLTNNGSGGGSGVSDINGLTGSITLQGTVNQVNVNHVGNIVTLSTPQDIATGSSPTFANTNVTGQYQVGGSQIASTNLSDGANLAKLNGNQTFTGNNTFSSASNSFTGNGAGLTSLNASNVSSGTLNDARLSANVALLNANQTFTGYNTLRNSSNSVNTFQVQTVSSADILNIDTSTSVNLVTNGDLEGAGTGGWLAKGASTLSQSSAQAWQGNDSLSAATTTAANDGASYAYTFGPTTQYTLSLYAKVSSGSVTDVNIGRQDNGSDIDCLAAQTLTTAWTRFACTFTTGGTISGSNIYIKKTGASAETVFVDGVQLQTGASVTAFNAGGAVQFGGVVNSPTTFQNKSDSKTAFQIQNAAGTSNLLVADTINTRLAVAQASANYTLDVGGDINTTGVYRVNGSQISTTNLSDNANIALLNGNQTFTGNNTFSSASNNFTGSGAGLTSLNASNVSSGTLNDARLSANVALLNAHNTFQNTSNSATSFEIQNAAGTSNLFIADTTNTRLAIAQATANYTLDVGGDINTTTGYRVAGTPGSTVTCTSGNVVQNAVISGGIITGGTCAANGGGSTPTFNTVYTNGTTASDETSTLTSSRGGIIIQDNSSPIGASLFTVQSNGGTSKYLDVTSAGISVAGDANVTGLYKVNGTQISSANLSNDANLAKLNANQTFSGNNTFSGTVLAQNTSNSTTAFQIQNALGTSNLFIANTTNSRIGINKAPTQGALDVNGAIYQSGNQVCDTSGNCVGTGGGGGIGGGGTAGKVALFTGSGFTIGDSVITQTSGNISVSGNATFKPTSDSTAAFTLQNAGGSNLLNVDSTNYRISSPQTNVTLTDSSTPTGVGVVAGANTGGSLSGSASTTYYYNVTAIGANGESLPSSEVSINGQSFTKLSAPGALTVGAPSAGGSVTIGTHSYQVTFVTANGETTAGTTSAQVNVTTGGTQTVPLTAIPTGPSGTTARKIYRTVSGDTGSYKLVTTLNDNTTTTFNDTIADGSLGVVIPGANTATTNTNNASVSWTLVSGATSYRIYRGNNTGGEFAYQTNASSPFTDTGAGGTTSSPPTHSSFSALGIGTSAPTANLDVRGTALFKNVADNTSALQVQNAAGSTVLNVSTNANYYDDFESGNMSPFVSASGWSVANGNGLNSSFAAGSTTDGTSITLTKTLFTSGTISFWMKQTDQFAGGFNTVFKIDSTTQLNLDATSTPYTFYSFSVSAGTHTFYWQAGQTFLGSPPSIYIDDVTVTNAGTALAVNNGSIGFGTTDPGSTFFDILAPSATSSAFQVQSSSGNSSVFNIDTTTNSATINQGNLTVTNLSSPSAPSLTSCNSCGGTISAATYYYAVAAVNANGTTPAVISSPASVAPTGGASKNTLTWSAVANAGSYNVYRSTDNVNWKVNNVSSATLSIVDNGSTYTWGTSATLPTTNTTGGNLTVNGTGLFKNSTNSTTAFSIQDASAASILNADTTNRFIGIGTSKPQNTLDVETTSPSVTTGFESGSLSPFTQSGGFTAQGTNVHSGSFSAGVATSSGATLTLAATLTSPGTLSFWVQSANQCSGSNFLTDNGTTIQTFSSACGSISYTFFSLAESAGTHTFVWNISGTGGPSLYLDDVTLTNATPQFYDSFETGSLSPFTQTGGFSAQLTNVHSGSFSAGVVSNSATLTLVKTLSSAGTLSFWAQSANGCSGSNFLQDNGSTIQTFSSGCGSISYTFFSFAESSGSHTLDLE